MTDASLPTGPSLDIRAKVYVWLTAIFVACLLVADVVGIKLFRINVLGWQVEHTCGMLTFPITFLLTDLLNDYYGKPAARRVAYIAFAMGALVFGVINIALAMPSLPAPYNVPDEAFNAVFAKARIMYVASLAAFMVGSLLDIWIFGIMKRATGGRFLWLRATGSTVISQVFDSLVVSILAFHLFPGLLGMPADSIMPLSAALKTAATGYTLKFVLAVGITPLIYAGHAWLRSLGLRPIPVTDSARV